MDAGKAEDVAGAGSRAARAGSGDHETVKVAVRCRGLNSMEQQSGAGVAVTVHPETQQVTAGKKAFSFDWAYGEGSTQQHVYETSVVPLVQAFLSGLNASILAYGQTGAGKTYTMGTTFNPAETADRIGVIPRVLQDVFDGVEAAASSGEWTHRLEASYLEIYNEQVRDLLMPEGQQPPKRGYHMHRDDFGNYDVQGVTHVPMSSLHDLALLLERGAQRRATAATNMNLTSSRSHAIFTLRLEQIPAGPGAGSTEGAGEVEGEGEEKAASSSSSGASGGPQTPECKRPASGAGADSLVMGPSDGLRKVSVFRLVDLAGSERAKKTGAQGDRLREANNINQSLSTLGRCITALATKARHVPFRNSKLTQLLTNSLGGNSATLMIACVSPADSSFEETLNTLRYADTASSIENKPVVNADPHAASVVQLRGCISELRRELARLYAQGAGIDADILRRYDISGASGASPRKLGPAQGAVAGIGMSPALAGRVAWGDERPITGTGAGGAMAAAAGGGTGMGMVGYLGGHELKGLREELADAQAQAHRANADLAQARRELADMGTRGRWAVEQASRLLEENTGLEAARDKWRWRFETVSASVRGPDGEDANGAGMGASESKESEETDSGSGSPSKGGEEAEESKECESGLPAATRWVVNRLRACGEAAALRLVGEKDEELRGLRHRLQSLRAGLEGVAAVTAHAEEESLAEEQTIQSVAMKGEEDTKSPVAAPAQAGTGAAAAAAPRALALLAADDATAAESRTFREHLDGMITGVGGNQDGEEALVAASGSLPMEDPETAVTVASVDPAAGDAPVLAGPQEADVVHIKTQMQLRGQLQELGEVIAAKQRLLEASQAHLGPGAREDEFQQLSEEYKAAMQQREEEVAALEAKCRALAEEVRSHNEVAEKGKGKAGGSQEALLRKKDQQLLELRGRIKTLQEEMKEAHREQRARERGMQRVSLLQREIEDHKRQRAQLDKKMGETARKYREEKQRMHRQAAQAAKRERQKALELSRAKAALQQKERALEAARQRERAHKKQDELLRRKREHVQSTRAAAQSGGGRSHRGMGRSAVRSVVGGGDGFALSRPRGGRDRGGSSTDLPDLAGDTTGLEGAAAALVEECLRDARDQQLLDGQSATGAGREEGLEGIDLGQDGERALPVASRALDAHSQAVVRRALYYRAQAAVWLRRAEAWVKERARLAMEVDELGKRAVAAMEEGAAAGVSSSSSSSTPAAGDTCAVLSQAIEERKRRMVALTLRIQDAQSHRQHFHGLCEEEGLTGDGWIRRVLAENKLPRRLARTVGSRLLRWFATMVVTLNLRLFTALGEAGADAMVADGGADSDAASASQLRSQLAAAKQELQAQREEQQRSQWRLQQQHAMAQHDDAETIAALRVELAQAEARVSGAGEPDTNTGEAGHSAIPSDETAAARKEAARLRLAFARLQRRMAKQLEDARGRTDRIESDGERVSELEQRVVELESRLAEARRSAHLASAPRTLTKIPRSAGRESQQNGERSAVVTEDGRPAVARAIFGKQSDGGEEGKASGGEGDADMEEDGEEGGEEGVIVDVGGAAEMEGEAGGPGSSPGSKRRRETEGEELVSGNSTPRVRALSREEEAPGSGGLGRYIRTTDEDGVAGASGAVQSAGGLNRRASMPVHRRGSAMESRSIMGGQQIDQVSEPASKLRRVMTGVGRPVSELSGIQGGSADADQAQQDEMLPEATAVSEDEEEEDEEFVEASNGGFERAQSLHTKQQAQQQEADMAGRLRGKSIYGMRHAAFGSSVRRDAPVDHAKRVDERRRVLRQSVRRSKQAESGAVEEAVEHGSAAAGGAMGQEQGVESARQAARRRRRQRGGMDPGKLAAAQSAVESARGVASGLASRPPRAEAAVPGSQAAAPPPVTAAVSTRLDLSGVVEGVGTEDEGLLPMIGEEKVGSVAAEQAASSSVATAAGRARFRAHMQQDPEKRRARRRKSSMARLIEVADTGTDSATGREFALPGTPTGRGGAQAGSRGALAASDGNSNAGTTTQAGGKRRARSVDTPGKGEVEGRRQRGTAGVGTGRRRASGMGVAAGRRARATRTGASGKRRG